MPRGPKEEPPAWFGWGLFLDIIPIRDFLDHLVGLLDGGLARLDRLRAISSNISMSALSLNSRFSRSFADSLLSR
jgi:hypothetical protein